jgi:predicted regulator of Ras-like GTPase activity (Roadblock/LC7/MglB family)
MTSRSAQLSWLLDDLVKRVPSTRQAVVLSADGLPLGSSTGITREDSEHLAALASGFASLSRGASRHFKAGTVRQTIIEMESAFLFVTAAGRGACLAVLADDTSDIGVIAYEMAMLVTRVGHYLDTPSRQGTEEHDRA